MTDSYSDIINMEKPVSHHARMPACDRAVQFAPFASLTGFDAQISETARLTDKKPELNESELEQLNDKLRIISSIIKTRPLLDITRFVKDSRKDGGALERYSGRIRKLDALNRVLIFEDGETIPADDIIGISSEIFELFYQDSENINQ